MTVTPGVRTLTILFATLALALWPTRTVLASHYDYLAEDPDLQHGAIPYENWVYRQWWVDVNGSVSWWAAPTLYGDALQVVQNWEAAFPQLTFYYESYEPDADLKFGWGDCGGDTIRGCVPAALRVWQLDTILDANFWIKTTIYLNNASPQFPPSFWITNEKRETLAHELGHFYGLHEQYTHNPVNCSPEVTVMDAGDCETLQGPAPDDPLNPDDRDRVRGYWELGQMAWMIPVLQPNGDILWQWTDHAWSEYHQQFNAFWSYGPPAWQWNQYVQWFPYQDRIGLHETMAPFTEYRTMSKTTPPPVRNVLHVACGHPFFKNFEYSPDNWTCSPLIFVPVPSLVSHWKFDDSWGTNATDSSGYGNHGTLVNNPAWSAPGWVGPYSLSLDGVDDYVTVADSDSLTFGAGTFDKPFSIALWAKPDVVTGKVNGLLSKAIEYNRGEYNLLLEWSRVTFRVIDDSTRGTLARNADGAVSTPGFWYHIVGTYNGSRTVDGIRIYVNGVLANSVGASGGTYVAMEDTPYSMSIGDYRPTDPDRFDGLLDEVRVYNYALTAAEVQALCNCP